MEILGRIVEPVRYAYVLYLRHPQVWLLSLPVAALRAFQVTRHLDGATGVLAEVAVELLRIVQGLVAIAAAKGISPLKLTTREAWKPREAGGLNPRNVVLGLIGYAVVALAVNGAVAIMMSHPEALAAVAKVVGSDVPADALRSAGTLALKNLTLIPVSVLMLLRIFRLIP